MSNAKPLKANRRLRIGDQMTGWWFAPSVALGLTGWAIIAMMVV